MATRIQFSTATVLVFMIVAGFFMGMNVRGQTTVKQFQSGEYEIKSEIHSYGWPFIFYESGNSTVVAFEKVLPAGEHAKHETDWNFGRLLANIAVAFLGAIAIVFFSRHILVSSKKIEDSLASRP